MTKLRMNIAGSGNNNDNNDDNNKHTARISFPLKSNLLRQNLQLDHCKKQNEHK